MPKAVKVLDATSGNGSIFQFADNGMDYRFTISGSPSSNIIVFVKEKTRDLNAATVKVKCANWNGASAKLQSRLISDDNVYSDDFNDTGDVFTEDETQFYYYS